MRIYKTSDRIPIQIDGLVFYISPMSVEQKADVMSQLAAANGDVKKMQSAVYQSVKLALKDVDGLEQSDGSPFKLSFQDGLVSDESIEILTNLPCSAKIINTCSQFLEGVPSKFKDEGVSYVVDPKSQATG